MSRQSENSGNDSRCLSDKSPQAKVTLANLVIIIMEERIFRSFFVNHTRSLWCFFVVFFFFYASNNYFLWTLFNALIKSNTHPIRIWPLFASLIYLIFIYSTYCIIYHTKKRWENNFNAKRISSQIPERERGNFRNLFCET